MAVTAAAAGFQLSAAAAAKAVVGVLVGKVASAVSRCSLLERTAGPAIQGWAESGAWARPTGVAGPRDWWEPPLQTRGFARSFLGQGAVDLGELNPREVYATRLTSDLGFETASVDFGIGNGCRAGMGTSPC